MKQNNHKHHVQDWALQAAIEGLDELAKRLEWEAAAFAQLNTRDAIRLAEDRLEQAEQLTAAANYFGTL